ncbi:MAG: beta-ketoacyl synthase N-terminal-like domain-containing protein, partial [Psychromonas sp.]|nr:beta-ketoacyl synthase N-terminal-like domain-containing protein [Psychromonas sp.]
FSVAKAAVPLAIVGMDCLFGSAGNLSEFKTLLATNADTFRKLPPNRWKGLQQSAAIKQTLQLNKAPKGGYIEQFDIDFLRFKIPPNEQDCLIPQQLLMMKVADNAAKDARLKEGSNVAVLVAMGMELDLHQYRGRVNLTTQIEESLQQLGIELTAQQQERLTDIAKQSIAAPAQLNQYTSFIGNIMASRISALWDFSGPAFSVSSEENSVYRCVELADNLFRTSDVEAVLIASVDLAGSFENISLRQHYGAVSESATNSPNLLDSEKWLVGEGAGAFVVKPGSQNRENTAYALIDALSFVNGCDADAIITASNNACAQAAIKTSDITAVEAFASGFSAENQAEKAAFARLYNNQPIDSVKRQIGHLFNASGMASIIKSALLLEQRGAGNYTAINGLGRDLSCAHLILSAPKVAREIVSQAHSSKPFSLIKPITLGGQAIAQSILAHAQDPLFNTIRLQLQGKHSSTLLNPVALNLLNVKRAVQSMPTKPPQSSNCNYQTVGAGVNMSSKTSQEILQQTQTHQAFLRARQVAGEQIAKLIQLQAQIALEHPSIMPMPANTVPICTPVAPSATEKAGFEIKGTAGYHYAPLNLVERFHKPHQVIYDSADLVEFAEGKISKVFGADYAIIDSYSRRVRLPTTDYLLVTRVTELDAQINEYKKSSMTTEYDIPVDAPFLIDGQIPWSVSVESGQCDLMLIAYIGIDFQNKGERVYRLLDCELTFLEEMA